MLAFTYLSLIAGKLPKADRVCPESTPEQKALIREGVALHDQQNYDAAIERYKKVLDESPWDARALHELSYSYFESKRYEEALATAKMGAQCKSDGLPAFYMLIGNALDMLGRNKESIEVYKEAIKQNPGVSLLHYNLALALNAGGKKGEAKQAVENALRLSPGHASSHALLGSIYADMGYRIPAILAYSRFLMLEPASQRAKGVASRLAGLLTGNVTYGKEPNQINIMISAPSKKQADEGDFGGSEAMLAIMVAGEYTLKPEKPEESGDQIREARFHLQRAMRVLRQRFVGSRLRRRILRTVLRGTQEGGTHGRLRRARVDCVRTRGRSGLGQGQRRTLECVRAMGADVQMAGEVTRPAHHY